MESERRNAANAQDFDLQRFPIFGLGAEDEQALVAFLHRCSNDAPQRIRASLQKLDEVVMVRNARGRIVSAYGFEYSLIIDGASRYRVTYVAFAHKHGAAPHAEHARTIGAGLYKWQHSQDPDTAFIWACPREVKPLPGLFAGGATAVRRLAPGSITDVSYSVGFFTDLPPEWGRRDGAPSAVREGISRIVRSHCSRQREALLGQSGPESIPQPGLSTARLASVSRRPRTLVTGPRAPRPATLSPFAPPPARRTRSREMYATSLPSQG